jgi:hypothetical protein
MLPALNDILSVILCPQHIVDELTECASVRPRDHPRPPDNHSIQQRQQKRHHRRPIVSIPQAFQTLEVNGKIGEEKYTREGAQKPRK